MEMTDLDCTSDQDLETEKEQSDGNPDVVLPLNTAESVELRGSGSQNRKRTSILTLFANWNLALITASVAFLWSVNLIGMGRG